VIRDWIAVRVDPALAGRLNALVQRLGVTRHELVRKAVFAGLEALERQPTLPEVRQ
jgi:hypothetical protein